MKYVGSKNRLSKELAPIIQSYITDNTVAYIEPFVGGANMIDKIKHHNKIGSDIHKELIALHNYNKHNSHLFPDTISEETYKHVKNNRSEYEDWFVGLVGFGATFGAKYFGGYARCFKADKVTPRDMPNEAINNLKKQSPKIQDVDFKVASFLDYKPSDYKDCVFYLDPPYRNTKTYNGKKGFDYEKFYDFVRELSKHNFVFISEYNMPSDFKCIWSKERKVVQKSDRKEAKIAVEKLFILNGRN